MQMKRYPDGVDGFFFYQKRVPEPHPDWLDTFRIHFPSGRNANFPVVADAGGLAWIANLGCIELHTWHSRIDDIQRPDYLLIDLDPSEGNPWSSVRKIAMVVKEVMDELGELSVSVVDVVAEKHADLALVVEPGLPRGYGVFQVSVVKDLLVDVAGASDVAKLLLGQVCVDGVHVE